MIPEQITAIAREYAELTDGSPADIAYIKAIAENTIRFLLRRFCLVEKAKLEKEYHEAKFACGNVDPCSETWTTYLAQKSLIERLFPEIAKEVEE